MQDSLLIHKVQNGDSKALERLVEKYYDSIYQYCYRHTNYSNDAQDLTQETFMKVIQNFDDYRHYGKFQNYLYVISGNLCRDYYKKKKPEYKEDMTSIMDECSYADRCSNDIDKCNISMDVRKALSILDDNERNIVILRYYQELKFKDIAKITGCGESLVRYHLKKAMLIMKDNLEGGRQDEK